MNTPAVPHLRIVAERFATRAEARDIAAVNQAVNFARRWAKDWPTWCICLELILMEWEGETWT